MRSPVCVGLLLLPSLLVAQEGPPEVRARLDTLLTMGGAEAVISGLDERFLADVRLLVPDLTPADGEVLTTAIQDAFTPEAVRGDILSIMSAAAAPDELSGLLVWHRTGADAEIARLADAYEPPLSLNDFVAGLGTPPRDRLQLMASLAEAEGAGDFDLLVDEALRAAANEFVARLGGEIAPYEPLSDAAWSEAYRQKLVMRSLELLHRLEPVPDDLIRRAIEEHSAAPARRYADGYVAALQDAIYKAGARAAALAVEEATAELPPDPGRPCRGQPCGFLVEWQGRPPNGPNRRFGDAGQLENLVLRHLVGAGYLLERGPSSGGLTVRLRPRTAVGLCDFMSGTDNTGCLVIDNVRVDFLGEYPGYGTPEGFLVRNRCGADGAMAVDGVAVIVALRLHALLAPDPDVEIPRC